jgi:signal transduction histidine kinase
MGQLLTAVTFNLAAIEKELKPDSPPEIEKKVLDTRMIVDQLMHQVRDLSLELRPAMLQDLGLEPTLRWYINTLANRRDIEIKFETVNLEGRYSEPIETGLYRIIQEALTNVSKHSNASSVQLCLERNESQIHLQIEDNGQGFDVEKVLASSSGIKGVGLVAIRERINSLNGDLQIRSEPGKGTQLLINIPMENNR